MMPFCLRDSARLMIPICREPARAAAAGGCAVSGHRTTIKSAARETGMVSFHKLAIHGVAPYRAMGRKILIVEDDVPTGDYIAAALHQQGYTTDRAATGRDGLFHATDATYDCIVLDRMLPGMNGMSV